MNIFQKTSFQISKQVTRNYSTSFYSASCLFHKDIRYAIFSIYGFVRLADEIVDTFHSHNRRVLLHKLESDYYNALENGISLNPILHSFQLTVKKYEISDQYIQAFLKSMKCDLSKTKYDTLEEINDYIYGSADVVGLMCLKVFCKGNESLFRELKEPARKLGSAFQKVNFLRDLKNDMENLDRRYFPSVDKNSFNENTKTDIIKDIENDFKQAFQGLKKLPQNSKLAVLVAYLYYLALLKKIKHTPSQEIISKRIRLSTIQKILLLLKAHILNKLDII